MNASATAARAGSYALSVLKNRIGAVPRPSWCTYLVCFRCNARCSMCDSWRLPKGNELTVEQVRDIFTQVGRLDVVRLSGGEPFLRKDFAALAEAVMAASDPAVLHITTNGSFPDRVERFAKEFSTPRRLQFMVSLDGVGETHDENRGKRVTYTKATETLRRLVALRDRGLSVSVNHTVISAESMADSGLLNSEMAALGVDVQSVLAYEESAMYGVALHGTKAKHLIVPKGYPLHPRLAESDTQGFIEQELARVEEMRSVPTQVGKRYYLNGLLSRLRGDADPRPRPKCVAVRSHLRLLPDGSVPVCQFNTETLGNLARQSFEEVWSSVAAAEARRWVDGCPGCWAECEVMPSAMYSGDILNPLNLV